MAEEKKGKGWFSKVSDVFMEDDTEVTESNEEINVSNTGSDSASEDLGSAPINIPATGDGVFDNKFNDFFQGLIAENNLDGIDYFEFREALKGMSSLPNESKFQMAFNTLKIGDANLSKETLLKSIDHYDGILGAEEQSFEAEMESETNDKVTSLQQKAAELLGDNQTHLQEIKNLQDKIAENQKKSIELNEEAALSQVKIVQTGKNFTKTLTKVRAGLSSDKAMISELVKETKTA